MAIKYKNLKAEMIRKSVSNGKMAEVLGVTEQTFRRKLTGDVSVTIDEAQTLMRTLFKGCGFTMANVTPFETQDLLDASKTLLNFGISAKEVMPDLQMLGDIAGGDKQRMASLTLAFSQMSSAGRLMGQDLLQMINAGFNPLEEIARKTGKSIGYWKDEMSKGNVSVEMVRQAFIDATSEGGRFYKMMDKQSETLEGRLSTMNDAYVLLLRSISDGFVPALKDGAVVMTDVINQTTESISKFNDWAATNTQVVGGLTDMSIAIAALAAGIPLTNTAVVAIIASMRNFGTVTAKTTAFQIAFVIVILY